MSTATAVADNNLTGEYVDVDGDDEVQDPRPVPVESSIPCSSEIVLGTYDVPCRLVDGHTTNGGYLWHTRMVIVGTTVAEIRWIEGKARGRGDIR